MNGRRYLSIGEVLGLLLEEFPDVTISKIRFLESQGLIDPERTPSGYRKFYDVDVERLRVILREQRENFLPLRVIKHRLDSGELSGDGDNTTGSIRLPHPRGAAWLDTRPERGAPTPSQPLGPEPLQGAPRPVETLPAPVDPSGAVPVPVDPSGPWRRGGDPSGPLPAPTLAAAPAAGSPVSRPQQDRGAMSAEELCRAAGVEIEFLDELESYGLLRARLIGSWRSYDDESCAVVMAAAALCRRGLEPRHLRQWRTTVDKELGLIEQLVAPLLRQRNPAAREQAGGLADDLEHYGAELRAALVRKGLRLLIG